MMPQGGRLLLILSQLGLQSDFLAGFLLFHITTIIKTPTMKERTDSARKLLIMGTFKTHCSEKQNLSRASDKQFCCPEAQTAKVTTNTGLESLRQAELRQEPQRACQECHTLANPLATLFSLPNLEDSN